jgi:hypothetical protein
MEEKSLALTVNDALKLGEIFYKSGYFSDIKSASQAVVKILRGQELGLPPVTSLEQVYVINGKTALGASLIASKIKASGKYDYKIKRLDDTGCELVFIENGKEIGTSSFTFEDAKKAGLVGRDTWQKYPRNLYFARALSNGAKWYCPDVFMGPIYVPEELEEIGEDITITIEEPPKEALSEEPVEPKEEKPTVEEAKTEERLITDKQVSLVWAMARNRGIEKEELYKIIEENTGKKNIKELTFKELNDVLQVINSFEKKEEGKNETRIQKEG